MLACTLADLTGILELCRTATGPDPEACAVLGFLDIVLADGLDGAFCPAAWCIDPSPC